MRQFFLLFLIAATLGMACNREDQATIDRNLILDYLSTNNIEAEEDASGLFYRVITPGGSEKPLISQEVTVRYKGYFLDGTIFDQTEGNSDISFPLSGVIVGWQLGIPKIGEGGTVHLYIPSALAYGRTGRGSIPPNTPLIFEVDLVNF